MYDVAVIGGGPAGATAAKRLAESGLHTVLLEKHVLPRDKICSGFLMDAWPLVRAEFGEVPDEVLCTEKQLRGIALHVPGAGSHFVAKPFATAWRSNLDRWLVQRAAEAGAELHEGAGLTGLEEDAEGYTLHVGKGDAAHVLRARYVVGADGTTSTVRQWLYPDLKVVYSQAVQEVYQADANLPRDAMNLILSVESAPFYFDVIRKDGLLVFECGARLGEAKAIMDWGRRTLAAEYGFDPVQRPVKHGACTEPVLFADLFSGQFRPARGRALLVGDAAGLIMPVTGEGILGGVRSAQLAAESIVQSSRSGIPPADAYLSSLEGMISELRTAFDRVRTVRHAARDGGPALLAALTRAWEETLGQKA